MEFSKLRRGSRVEGLLPLFPSGPDNDSGDDDERPKKRPKRAPTTGALEFESEAWIKGDVVRLKRWGSFTTEILVRFERNERVHNAGLGHDDEESYEESDWVCV